MQTSHDFQQSCFKQRSRWCACIRILFSVGYYLFKVLNAYLNKRVYTFWVSRAFIWIRSKNLIIEATPQKILRFCFSDGYMFMKLNPVVPLFNRVVIKDQKINTIFQKIIFFTCSWSWKLKCLNKVDKKFKFNYPLNNQKLSQI